MSSLGTADIVGLAVGVPAGVLALVTAVIAFCAWRYPKTPVGQLGVTVHDRLVAVRGGDARGGDYYGRKGGRAGDAHGGDVNISIADGQEATGGTAVGGRASAV
jgi:hypothetical protein